MPNPPPSETWSRAESPNETFPSYGPRGRKTSGVVPRQLQPVPDSRTPMEQRPPHQPRPATPADAQLQRTGNGVLGVDNTSHLKISVQDFPALERYLQPFQPMSSSDPTTFVSQHPKSNLTSPVPPLAQEKNDLCATGTSAPWKGDRHNKTPTSELKNRSPVEVVVHSPSLQEKPVAKSSSASSFSESPVAPGAASEPTPAFVLPPSTSKLATRKKSKSSNRKSRSSSKPE